MILLLLLVLIPPPNNSKISYLVITHQVDLIELSHVHNEFDYSITLDQVIMWKAYRKKLKWEKDYVPTDIELHFVKYDRIHHVHYWYMLPKTYRKKWSAKTIKAFRGRWLKLFPLWIPPTLDGVFVGGPLSPKYDPVKDVYYVKFFDDNTKTVIRIESHNFRETDSVYDPELRDRERFPAEYRADFDPPLAHNSVKEIPNAR